MSPSKTKWKQFTGYGAGDFGLNLYWQSVGFYLFFFYTDVVGVPSRLVGTIFLIGSIWDALTDPLMGYLAERTKSRWGPYRPFLLLGAAPLGFSFALLFTPIHIGGETLQAIYLLAVLLAFRTAYTMVSIPYAALGARIARKSDDRTRLAGIRMYCGFLGGISVSFLAKWLQEVAPDQTAFPVMGLMAGVIGCLILILSFLATPNTAHIRTYVRPPASLGKSLASILVNRPFLLLIGGIILVTIANTIVGQSLLYVFESQMGDRDTGNSAIVIMTGIPLISIPLWAVVALKVGKRNAWIAGSVIASTGLALLYSGLGASPFPALACMTIVTLGLSSYAVIFWSMLPDTIEYGEFRSMVQNESLLIGIASSFQKISIGLSAFALGILLDLVGYRPEEQASSETAAGILTIFTVIPIVALLASSALIAFYPLTSKLHGELLEALEARKNQ